MSDDTRPVSGIRRVWCATCLAEFPSIDAFELHWAAAHADSDVRVAIDDMVPGGEWTYRAFGPDDSERPPEVWI